MRTWKTAALGLIMASFTGCSSSEFLEESPPKGQKRISKQTSTFIKQKLAHIAGKRRVWIK